MSEDEMGLHCKITTPLAAAFASLAVSILIFPLSSQATVVFSCDKPRLQIIKREMNAYLHSLDVRTEAIDIQLDVTNSHLTYSLNTPTTDTETLTLSRRPELNIKDDIVMLPTNKGTLRRVSTVSKKEIVYALFQHGRITEYRGDDCNLESMTDNVGIRQNTVAWVEKMDWNWPDGGSAQWNKKYWKRGTPIGNYPLAEVLADTFKNQKLYAIGCYTATKIAMAHGIVDYYARVKKDAIRLKRVTDQLVAIDGEPLVNVEPGQMWYFEDDFDSKELNRPGKVLKIQSGVAPKNFVPGDWSYFLNTDKETYQKTGYEGSNSIYLGRDRFDDYYHDQESQFYTFREKLDEVYQWRNKVFSRSRDAAKIRKLSEDQFEQLTETPQNNGLILDYRVFPMSF